MCREKLNPGPGDPLDRLPLAALERMLAAGEEIVECVRVLHKADLNLVGEVLRGHGTFVEFEHYPPDDVFDADSHSQYYYHAHRDANGEHGHFHLFLRRQGMHADVRPVPNEGQVARPEGDDALAHLVAISMDAYGLPIGLFTTNRWVTDEAWYPGADIIRMLDGFSVDHAHPSWPVNRWLTAMMILFRPTIEALILRRDQAIDRWRSDHPGADVFEDRALEVTSETSISIDEQILRVRTALADRRSES